MRGLIRDHHPDLADLPLLQVVGGWDNQQWRLGDDLAVRLPRTPRGPELLRKEYRWLPELAPRLPLPVPVPQRIGEPTEQFPHTWLITTWVPGQPADRTPISDHGAADTLAAFLRALHQQAPADGPVSPGRGVPLRTLELGFEEILADLEVDDTVRKIWAEAVAAPEWAGPPMWLHGDLHPANVVVEDGVLTGVIDFGDLSTGDPACDLAAAWILLPDGAADRFFEVYAIADESTITRARGCAAGKALALISVGDAGDKGLPGGKPTWGPAGRRTLERLLAVGW
ncbi:aminoglycoside phosphotransferase (APT) family kinase protein [Kribbella steppae]|uniref:Aminoglycoside phosphotransferase (APT) family kinase protein n=1 Tax=Kribbella steppae TaxID=2512223 RepID=A0A4R2HS08_9ACTN|nr:aminoglycoside phosphotransferase family protein [Kribbella steppae]TCO34101.1 aminoglycoside phosphotransferase (APT) family kinase protein [Kribbella steppae]